MRFLLAVILLLPVTVPAQSITIDTIYSAHANDRFIITIKKPLGFSLAKNYHFVYMTDGSLGIGNYILGKNDSWKATIPPTCIIIAISHSGDYQYKRTRDFIPSDIRKNAEPDFGKADKFYLFMKTELLPWVEKQLPNKKDRVFIGHSFGGLFCLYTLFRDDKLFNFHYAISPSVWANYYELDKIEEDYFKKHGQLDANVTIYAGTLEFFNKVLTSSRSFYHTMRDRKYSGLNIFKEEVGYANHYSIRKPAVDKIFESLKD
jgi:predicted alpha/beta superfamily hydrolase